MQPTADQPTSTLTGPDIDLRPGLVLPLPDDAAGAAARERLSMVDLGVSAPTIAALGMLAEAVVSVAAVQGTPYPRPFLSTRVVLLTGSHSGGVVAGPAPDPRHATPLQHLAINAGAGIVTLEWQPAAAAIELEDAITTEQMDASLRAGWAEADRAADEGIELLVLAAGGPGASVAAAAVVAAITGAEPTMLLTRVVTPAGFYDDNAWMTRCLALRDALHRVRDRDGDPRTVLAALGGADLAAATGLILGAAARRTPVMIDGPVGAAAALLANDFCPQSRSWLVLPDTGRHPAVRLATDSLQLRPWLDLCLDLGEGTTSLAALPLLQTALTLAGAGEEVEPQPLSRFDSTGNQVFVGVAKPVDTAEGEPVAEEAVYSGSTMETAPVVYASANANGEPAGAMAAGAVPSPTEPGEATADAPATRPAAKAARPDSGKPAPQTGKPTPGAEKPAAKAEPVKPAAEKAEAAGTAAPAAATPAGGTAGSAATAGPAKPETDKPRPPAEPGARPAVKAPTRTATKPPVKAGGKQALTGRTAASKAVPAKATRPAAGKDNPPAKQAPGTKDTPADGGSPAGAGAESSSGQESPAGGMSNPAGRAVAPAEPPATSGNAQADGAATPAASDPAPAGTTTGPASTSTVTAVDDEPTGTVGAGSAPGAPRPRKRP